MVESYTPHFRVPDSEENDVVWVSGKSSLTAKSHVCRGLQLQLMTSLLYTMCMARMTSANRLYHSHSAISLAHPYRSLVSCHPPFKNGGSGLRQPNELQSVTKAAHYFQHSFPAFWPALSLRVRTTEGLHTSGLHALKQHAQRLAFRL